MISDLPCVIHGYTFRKLIGKGGFSSVYLVQSERYPMVFCAKVMPIATIDAGSEEAKTAINEMNSLIMLNHPHILRLYDHFKDSSHFFLIIEFCSGGSLSNEVSRAKGLPLDRFIVLSRQIISALATCHNHNIAHHDIKLGNILLDEFGRAKLADFGISVHVDRYGDLCESFAGSIEYESPELLNKKPHDPFAADIWALGVLFAHMIGGVSPWRCDTIGKLKKCIAKGLYRLPRDIPQEIADIIAQMIVVEPEKRITMEKLRNLPIFQMNDSTVDVPLNERDDPNHIPDCLSPIGRQMALGRANLPFLDQTMESSSIDFTEDENPINHKSSTTLSICALNLLKGRSSVPFIRTRYHPKPKASFEID